MKKAKLYLDTSVIGGLYDDEFKEPTQRLFAEIRAGVKIAVISDLTLNELAEAPEEHRKQLQAAIESIPLPNVEYVETENDMIELAEQYLRAGVVSEQFRRDALHIAIATVADLDVVISWNFKHIVNWAKIRQYNSVNLAHGYGLIEIRSPWEVLDEEEV